MSDLIKRKDGSYSPRGLWDNIRANKGSGKKPTKEMLAQERKIKKMDDGGILDYIKKGISSAIDYINPFDSEETAKPVSKPVAKPIVKSKPLFSNELKLRQSVMESHHKPSIATGKEVSPKGAKGLTQIMPSMLSDFQRHNPGVKINLSNPKDAKAVQDWALDYIAQRPYLNKPNQDRKVYQAKVLAAYNWGPGNMKKFLGKQKSAGVDIYNSLNWIEKLPKEPRNYIKGILLNKLPGFQKQLERDTLNSPYNKYYNFGRGGMLWFNQKGGLLKGQEGLKTSAEATYNPETDTYDSRYSLPELTVTGKAPRDSFGTKVTPQQLSFNQNIHNAQGKALGTLARFTVGGPQQAIMYGLTGKAQYPSEAMGIENPVGAIATDIVTDPLVAGSLIKAGAKGLMNLRYSPAPGMMFRGIGEEGFKDAVESGLFRSKQNIVPEYYPGTELQINKSFGTNPYFTPYFATAKSYGSKYLAEVPRSAANWKRRYGRKEWSQIADRPIPITEGRILKKDWLRGYKPVTLPNKEHGGPIVDPRGQWAHPGKVTTIPGNDITMKGVPYPVFAETDKKQQVIMQPEQEYHFPGAKSVTEYPMPTTHAYKISKYLLPQHKEGGTMEKFGNVPYDAADAHKKPLSNGLWALPFKNGGQLYGKSGIHIKPENRGKFTASANRAGMGVQAFASKVLANKEKYSPTLVKRANFARNAAKWKHQFGGSIDTLKMALGGQMGSPKARISTPLRTDRSSAAGMMNFTEDSSPKARMFEGGDFPNSTFGDKTIPAKSYKMGGHMLSRPDHWVQAGDAVQDLNKNPQQSWYGESNRAKATAPVFQGGVKKPLMKMGGKTKFSKMC